MRRERISCARPYQGVIGTPAAKGDDRRSERFRLAKNPFISVVDDDDSVREALGALLRALEFEVGLFASALEFLRSDRVRKTDCLILDVRMPGMSGVELQRRLVETYRDVPVIFITAHGDEERRARALKGGAVDYLLKPFSEESLMNAVRTALSEK
ncbi:MAG: response regulator [Deltaproteobacteria bacterium]|nr:MAG: response regulator [Deltaproteobacteria bacterium]